MRFNWTKKNIDELNDVPYLESFNSNQDGLYLHCNFINGKKTIFFENYYVIRTIDEGNALLTLEQHNFNGELWMFVTDKSDLIDWFNKESYGIHESQFKHTMIVTQHQIIEILTNVDPQII